MMLALSLLAVTSAQADEPCWQPTTWAARRAVRRGDRAAGKGEATQAIALYRDALEAQPGCGAVQVDLGALLLAEGDLDGARAVLTPAMARFPEDAGVLVLVATVAARQGETTTARMLGRQALALAPDSLDALTLTHDILRAEGSWPAVDALLSTHAAHHPAGDIACLRVLSALDRGAGGEAADAMAQCEAGGQDGLLETARAYRDSAVHGAVVEDTEALQAINASILEEDWEGALEGIDALPLPLELSVRVVRATCLYNLDRQEEALADLHIALSGGERLIRNDPERSTFYTVQLRSAARMKARILVGQGEREAALAAIQDARERFGQEYDLHRTEIILLARSGEALQASAVWLDAAMRWPDEPDLFGALADIIQADRGAMTSEMWTFLGRSRSPDDQFAVATRRLEEGDIAGCLFHAEQSLSFGAADTDVVNLSYHCAVRAGELELAEQRRVQLGTSVLPMLLIQHALLVGQAGDTEHARALLAEACPRLSGAEREQCEAIQAEL